MEATGGNRYRCSSFRVPQSNGYTRSAEKADAIALMQSCLPHDMQMSDIYHKNKCGWGLQEWDMLMYTLYIIKLSYNTW